jgi:hypothetical protein
MERPDPAFLGALDRAGGRHRLPERVLAGARGGFMNRRMLAGMGSDPPALRQFQYTRHHDLLGDPLVVLLYRAVDLLG